MTFYIYNKPGKLDIKSFYPKDVRILLHPVVPFFKYHLSHLTEGEIRVWEKVTNLAVLIIHIVKQIPLDGIVFIIPVAVERGAKAIRHISQLMGLIPE